MSTNQTANIFQAASQTTAKRRSISTSRRTGEAVGQIVFTLAGLMVLTWLIGTFIYTMIPQSAKTKAVASKSEKADSGKSLQLTSHREKNEKVVSHTISKTDGKGSAQGTKSNSGSAASTDEPADATSSITKRAKEPKFVSPPANKKSEFANKNKEATKPEPELKTETVQAPQPKIDFRPEPINQFKPVKPAPKEPIVEVEKPAVKPKPMEPVTPEPMLVEPIDPVVVEPVMETPEIVTEPQPKEKTKKTFPMRDWISSTGGTARMAYIRRAENGDVIVINDEDKQFQVPFSRFSPVDQRYIEQAELEQN